MGKVVAPLSLFEIFGVSEPLVVAGDSWSDLEFEMALDSGAVVYVCSLEDCPGYSLSNSPLEAGAGRSSSWLTAGRSCVLCSKSPQSPAPHDLGNICDEGHNITFDAVQAVVRDKVGAELCKFHRTPGGLYVAKMKLRNPAGPGRNE